MRAIDIKKQKYYELINEMLYQYFDKDVDYNGEEILTIHHAEVDNFKDTIYRLIINKDK